MNLLGIDFGEKRIGIAMSLNNSVVPLNTINNTSDTAAIQEIGRYSIENKVKKIIIGIPLTADGKETPKARIVRRFGKKVKIYTKKPVEYYNEYGTSVEAMEYALDTGISQKRRKTHDHLAAAIILKKYITDLR